MPRERIQHGKLLIGPALDPKTGKPRRIQMENADGTVGEMVEVGTDRSGQEYFPGTPFLSEDERIYEQQSLDIVWNAQGGWVQLSIEAPTEWFQRALDPKDWGDTPPLSQSIATETLTRQQINQMIKTLRRARNAVFGVDE